MKIRLSCGITTIDDDICARGVRAGIGGEVDVGALELGSLGVTAKRDHAMPQLLDVLGHKVRQAGVDVSGRDGVDTCEVAPFVGQRSRQVDAAGFSHVVGRLFCRGHRSVYDIERLGARPFCNAVGVQFGYADLKHTCS